MAFSFSDLFSTHTLLLGAALIGVVVLAQACSSETPTRVLSTRFAGLDATHHCMNTTQGARCYYLVRPQASPRGLIVALHPAFHSVSATEKVAGFAPKAVAAGYAVLFPEGIDKQWNDGRHAERAKTFQAKTDDVGFLNSLITQVQGQLSIPPSRTLLAGMSNGGMMSLRMVCESDVFAAAFTVVANLPVGLDKPCTATPKAMLMIFGTADSVVPFAGGSLSKTPTAWGEVRSAEATIGFFAAHHGVQATPTISRLDAHDDKTVAEHRVYADAAHPLEAYVVKNMGHTWPNEPSQFMAWITTRGRVTREIDGNQLLLDFADKVLR